MLKNDVQYLNKKRKKILKQIKPLCKYFDIKYDYIIDYDVITETLILDKQEIRCTSNSINAVVDEVISYIFVTRVAKHRWLGHFEKQTLNKIKQYWKY